MQTKTTTKEEETESTKVQNNNSVEKKEAPKIKKENIEDALFSDDDKSEYESRRGSKPREVIKKTAPEGDDSQEIDFDDEDEQQEPVSNAPLTDEHRAAAKLFFFFYDDTSAKFFSASVYGDWDNHAQFRVYKDLSSPEYKDLIDCAAIVYRKWKFRFGPEMVIGASLIAATGMKWQLARKLKKERGEGLKRTQRRDQPRKKGNEIALKSKKPAGQHQML